MIFNKWSFASLFFLRSFDVLFLTISWRSERIFFITFEKTVLILFFYFFYVLFLRNTLFITYWRSVFFNTSFFQVSFRLSKSSFLNKIYVLFFCNTETFFCEKKKQFKALSFNKKKPKIRKSLQTLNRLWWSHKMRNHLGFNLLWSNI